MPYTRKMTTTRISADKQRVRVVVTGDECEARTSQARVQQHLLLQALADPMQQLLACGYTIPDKIVISHNGVCWQAEAEAEVSEQGT